METYVDRTKKDCGCIEYTRYNEKKVLQNWMVECEEHFQTRAEYTWGQDFTEHDLTYFLEQNRKNYEELAVIRERIERTERIIKHLTTSIERKNQPAVDCTHDWKLITGSSHYDEWYECQLCGVQRDSI